MRVDCVPLLDAVQDISAGNRKVPTSEFLESGSLAVVDQGQRLVAGYTDDSSVRVGGEPPLIVFGDHTRVFKYVDFPFAMGADGVKVLRPKEGFDPEYLYRYLQSRTIPSAGYSRHFKFLKEITVPRPPLDEQRRIADLLARGDSVRSRRSLIVERLDDLVAAVFRETAGPESWRAVTTASRVPQNAVGRWVPLGQVARLATGHTPDRARADYWSGDIPWISLPEIRGLDGRTALDTDLTVTEAGIANSSAVVLPEGTVCFSRTASIGFVTKMGRSMATSQDFHNWVPGPDLDPDYLMAALRYSRPHLLGFSDGSTHKTIYQRVAAEFRILLPSAEAQKCFSGRLAQINEVRRVAERRRELEQELFASLQSRAFRGEL